MRLTLIVLTAACCAAAFALDSESVHAQSNFMRIVSLDAAAGTMQLQTDWTATNAFALATVQRIRPLADGGRDTQALGSDLQLCAFGRSGARPLSPGAFAQECEVSTSGGVHTLDVRLPDLGAEPWDFRYGDALRIVAPRLVIVDRTFATGADAESVYSRVTTEGVETIDDGSGGDVFVRLVPQFVSSFAYALPVERYRIESGADSCEFDAPLPDGCFFTLPQGGSLQWEGYHVDPRVTLERGSYTHSPPAPAPPPPEPPSANFPAPAGGETYATPVVPEEVAATTTPEAMRRLAARPRFASETSVYSYVYPSGDTIFFWGYELSPPEVDAYPPARELLEYRIEPPYTDSSHILTRPVSIPASGDARGYGRGAILAHCRCLVGFGASGLDTDESWTLRRSFAPSRVPADDAPLSQVGSFRLTSAITDAGASQAETTLLALLRDVGAAHDVQLVDGDALTREGERYMKTYLPRIDLLMPRIFSLAAEPVSPEIPNESDLADVGMAGGDYISQGMEGLGGLTNLDAGSAARWLAMAVAAVIAVGIAVQTRSPSGAAVGGAFGLVAGAALGFIDVIYVAILAIVSALAVIYIMFLRKAT